MERRAAAEDVNDMPRGASEAARVKETAWVEPVGGGQGARRGLVVVADRERARAINEPSVACDRTRGMTRPASPCASRAHLFRASLPRTHPRTHSRQAYGPPLPSTTTRLFPFQIHGFRLAASHARSSPKTIVNRRRFANSYSKVGLAGNGLGD